MSLPPLDTTAILWIAALDRVPVEERAAWVAWMLEQVAYIDARRAELPPETGQETRL